MCRKRKRPRRIAAPLLLAAVLALPGSGQDDPLAGRESETRNRPEHLVVLRLSAEMLNSLINKQIDFQTPVRDVVLGTPITGAARVVGRPHVELEPAADRAQFKVVIRGTVHSQTVGRNGPAVVQGRAITYFTATKQIVFEPSEGFYGLPPTV